eukprot:4430040-Karenia_brevis.AAC.1
MLCKTINPWEPPESNTKDIDNIDFELDSLDVKWREDTMQFQFVTDNKLAGDVLNGLAVCLSQDLRCKVDATLKNFVDAISWGWGLGNSSLSWVRWGRRQYNALPDYVCNQCLKYQQSFEWATAPLPDLNQFNLLFRTDGGKWPGRGSASGWVLLGVCKDGLQLLAFGANFTTEHLSVFQTELQAIHDASAFFRRVLESSPSTSTNDPSFLPGVLYSLRATVASA